MQSFYGGGGSHTHFGLGGVSNENFVRKGRGISKAYSKQNQEEKHTGWGAFFSEGPPLEIAMTSHGYLTGKDQELRFNEFASKFELLSYSNPRHCYGSTTYSYPPISIPDNRKKNWNVSNPDSFNHIYIVFPIFTGAGVKFTCTLIVHIVVVLMIQEQFDDL